MSSTTAATGPTGPPIVIGAPGRRSPAVAQMVDSLGP
ncbi:Uncharacterised protein [Mycobacteroides abscessus subsp. abscessus]|nr:Uncharacterised protein [Mycobacteroides abscessus subsp. abscessus]